MDAYGTFAGDHGIASSKPPLYTQAWFRRFAFLCIVAACGIAFLGLSAILVAAWYGAENSSGISNHANFVSLHTDSLPFDMKGLVDASVDPCEDFYSYACGGFEKSASLQPDQLEFAYAWDSVSRNNTRRLQPIIAESTTAAGTFYRSCMNLSAIEALGLNPLRPFVRQIEEIKDLVSLTAVIYWLHKANVVVFYDWSVEVDPHNPSRFALYLMQGGITLPSTAYYTSEVQGMRLKREGFKQVARNVLRQICSLMTNCSESTWPKSAAENALDVETDLANLFSTPEEQRVERAEQYTIENLTAMAPNLHLRRFINAMAGTYHSEADTIAGKVKIMIRNPQYFQRASAYLSSVRLSHLKAYLFFRLGFVLGSDMEKKLEDTGFVLQKLITGQAQKVARWKKCMHATMNALPGDVGKLFVEHFFSLKTKESAEHMVLRLKMAFKEDVKSATWMLPETRGAALHKLHNMFFAVGAPSHFREYKGYELKEDKFLWNGLQLSEWYIHESFQRLTKSADRRRWGSTSPTMTDAFYSYTDNGLFVPAGILQEPFFSAHNDDARNFGHLGAIIGHEMTHGFDDQGRKFGAGGEMRNWWSAADVVHFKHRATCLVEQYSRFKVDGVPVNGMLTLGENIADNGGVKLSYAALAVLAEEKAKQAGRGRGVLSKAQERLFFTAWAQNWCSVERRRAEELQLMTDEHAPSRLRVNLPLANMPHFASAFSCPGGSSMNPAQRCILW